MRRAAKVDSNQAEVVAAFRVFGFSVLHLYQVGKGCPDILLGCKKGNVLVEIKDGKKPPSARELTSDEKEFHKNWRGPIYVIETMEDVITLAKKILWED